MSQPPTFDNEELFHRAQALPPAERADFLDRVCGADSARRCQLEDLIRAGDAAPHFLASPPDTEISAALHERTPELRREAPGEIIGRYKLLQKIGEGGCGSVWMAEQEQPVRRRVALKVIKLGMDTREVIARFEAERQALALMDHPNIAQVFDGGATQTGRPYFAMELVRGVPLTRFCDEQQLSTHARLELFTTVCHAVQHAHQKGIIHRDLKPSNILVTLHDGQPVPKVIDFGIAKATQGRLTDHTLFTAFDQFIGTPAYMSPEQAELSGLDIDTRSDIYSLGVLLYELLTGRPPFDPKALVSAGLDEIRRIIREVEPPRPSTRLSTLDDADFATIARQRGTAPDHLSTLLRGDLDWIIMRCLEKDRTRRYETVNGLAMDIRRHLRDEPVVARPPSARYRFQKFVRRNFATVITAAVVSLSLVGGLAVSSWQALRARRAEQLAGERLTLEERARRDADVQRERADALRIRAQQQTEEMGRHLYARRIRAAFDAWQQGDLLGATGALEPYDSASPDSDPRGFEWHYLWHLCHTARLTLRAGDAPTRAVAWTRDGQSVVTADADGSVRLWDAENGSLRARLTGHVGQVTSVAVSPRGTTLASGGEDGTVRLWTLPGGEPLATLGKLSSAIGALAFNGDGTQLAAGNCRLPGASGTPWTRLVSSQSIPTRVTLWDTATRSIRTAFDVPPKGVLSLAFAPDARRLATAAPDGRISVWRLPEGSLERSASPRSRFSPAFSVAYSPDGRLLVAGGGDAYGKDSFLDLWSFANGPDRSLAAHRGPVFAATFSPDGRRLISAGLDQIVQVSDVETGRPVQRIIGHSAGIWALALSPDGTRLATSSWDRTTKVWRLDPPQEFRNVSSKNRYCVSFHPGGEIFAASGTSLEILSARTGSLLHTMPEYRNTDTVCAFAPDGRWLATAGRDKTITLWDATTWRIRGTLRGHEDTVRSLAFSPDSRQLVSGGFMKDRTLRWWNVADLREIAVLRDATSSVEHLAFAPDGSLLFASTFAEILLIDPQQRTMRERWPGKDTRLVPSPDGRSWAVLRPEALQLLDGRSRAIRWSTVPHKDWVWSVVFSPDSRTLVSTSWDGTAKFWHVDTGQEMMRFDAGATCWNAAFSADGSTFVLGSGPAEAGTLAILAAPRPRP
ncbi:MAG: protein kinase [Verrucomicrobia bacterium]|nr:protein kinase [Verrucomicrobiota bacterium]